MSELHRQHQELQNILADLSANPTAGRAATPSQAPSREQPSDRLAPVVFAPDQVLSGRQEESGRTSENGAEEIKTRK